MNFEQMQHAWQAQKIVARTPADLEQLLKEVRAKEHRFRATIFWRDVREVGTAALLTLWFSFQGLRHHHIGDWLIAIACFGVGMFILIDRVIQHRKRPANNDSLRGCIESSLRQVSHQIWLLKNVLWWYLLPIAAALAVSIAGSVRSAHGATAMIVWGLCSLFIALLYWGIYRLNQFAVRKDLEPRRQELESLLASLN